MTEYNTESEINLYKSLLDFFGNPIVGFIGTLASIVSLVLAVIFWRLSIEVPQLSYAIDPVRISVVKMGEASDIKVFHKNKEVTGDISTVQIFIWNDGKKPIRGEDILSKIAIELSEPVPILEAKIVKLTRKVTNLSLDSTDMEQGKIGISWKILERNDGAVIQIIYNSNPDLQIKLKGIILGQNDPIYQTHALKVINNPQERYKMDVITFKVLGIFGIISSALLFMVSFSFLFPNMFLSFVTNRVKFSRSTGLVFLLLGILYASIGTWTLVRFLQLSPPFNP